MTIEQAERARAILIMEDVSFIRYDLVDFFEDRGFEAENADQAIALLEANATIWIVLTDVAMPGSMDGMKLGHYVRDRYPPTLLVVVSGIVKVHPSELPTRAAFIPKPFDLRSILRTIDRLAA